MQAIERFFGALTGFLVMLALVIALASGLRADEGFECDVGSEAYCSCSDLEDSLAISHPACQYNCYLNGNCFWSPSSCSRSCQCVSQTCEPWGEDPD